MSLLSEIGLRLLRIFYWCLWFAEALAVLVACSVLVKVAVGFDTLHATQLKEAPFLIGLPLIVVPLTHYILTIPIGKKLAEIKAND
jgi:hypothetical protein